MARKNSAGGPRQNPFRGFMDFMSEMNRAQSAFMLAHSGGGESSSTSAHSHAYVPTADIFAQDGDLFIRCEVAGVRQEDVYVNVTNGVLTISGHRESELDEDTVSYYARERSFGEFRRDMLLPEGVKSADVTARTKNGLLEIVVRGGASASTEQIEVRDDNDD